MASLPPTRCPGCGVFLHARPEHDDLDAQERVYHDDTGDLWQLHDCPALEQYGPRRETVTRAPRAERPRSTAGELLARSLDPIRKPGAAHIDGDRPDRRPVGAQDGQPAPSLEDEEAAVR